MPLPLFSSRTSLMLVPALAALLAACSPPAAEPPAPDLFIRVSAGTVDMIPVGEFLQNGMPTVPERQQLQIAQDIEIMRRQVSQAEYARCVQAQACRKLDKQEQQIEPRPDLPVVGVSWEDATAYADWLSRETGQHYRLPSYEEWAWIAGNHYREDTPLSPFDPQNPARRWLEEYQQEISRSRTTDDKAPQPFGHFGANEHGIQDLGGNVWDWTNSCYTRYAVMADQSVMRLGENCGIRILGGEHRSYMTDFIRDPVSGACSVGLPPANLGFRLVRDAVSPGHPRRNG